MGAGALPDALLNARRPATGACIVFRTDSRTASLKGREARPERPLDDAALMSLVGRGDDQAFSVLVRRHASRLYRIALRTCGDRHEAEDIVQESFARMWQQAPQWQPQGAGLIGWLLRVTINLCHDRRRRLRIVSSEAPPELIDRRPGADQVMETDEAQRALLAALADLPERYRTALLLCFYEGLPNALAAEVLDLNIKAMESLLVRARRQLRTVLKTRHLSARDLLPLTAGRAA